MERLLTNFEPIPCKKEKESEKELEKSRKSKKTI